MGKKKNLQKLYSKLFFSVPVETLIRKSRLPLFCVSRSLKCEEIKSRKSFILQVWVSMHVVWASCFSVHGWDCVVGANFVFQSGRWTSNDEKTFDLLSSSVLYLIKDCLFCKTGSFPFRLDPHFHPFVPSTENPWRLSSSTLILPLKIQFSNTMDFTHLTQGAGRRPTIFHYTWTKKITRIQPSKLSRLRKSDLEVVSRWRDSQFARRLLLRVVQIAIGYWLGWFV